MKVSKNELTSLIKQALEGCGFDAGRYESAADMTVWAEMHGLAVLEGVATYLLQLDGLRKPEINIQPDDDMLVVDATGASALECGELISDAIFAHAVTNGLCQAKVSALRDRQLIAKSLLDCSARGAHCLGYWADPLNKQMVHSITATPASRCPQIAWHLTGTVADNQALYLVYAMDKARLRNHVLEHCAFLSGPPSNLITPAELQAKYQHSIDRGIDIDDLLWQSLNSLAARVLVESNEQSRKGAGA